MMVNAEIEGNSSINRSYDCDTLSSASWSSIGCNQICENSEVPNISSKIDRIAMSNASDIHIGNRIIYNAPVTITHKSIKDKKVFMEKFFKKIKTQKKNLVIGIFVISLIISSISVIFLLPLNKNPTSEIPNLELYPEEKVIQGRTLKIVKRSEWEAVNPKGELVEFNQLPLSQLLIIHTVTAKCSSQSACGEILRQMQDYHINEKGWNDIGYNYIIGSDGVVYEGNCFLSIWQIIKNGIELLICFYSYR